MEKLVITCAVTGAFTTRQNNPNLPYTVKEIADEAVRAWEAGAAVVHLHMRNDDGQPVADAERFKETIALIKEKTDLVVNTTTGGGRSRGIPPSERLAVVPVCKPDLATLDIGAAPLPELGHFAKVMRENGVRPEVEVTDAGGIHGAQLLVEEGSLEPPLHFGFVLGMAGAKLPGSVKNLLFLSETVPLDSTWVCMGIGKHEFTLGATAIVLGGHVRCGFEDNVYLSRGIPAKSNGELVEKMVRISRELGREIASPAEARRIFRLKDAG